MATSAQQVNTEAPHAAVQTAVECGRVLREHYGSRLKGVVLYGSVARGEPGPQSDVDLLVLLEGPLDYPRELRRIVDLLYPKQLESPYLISAKPAPYSRFERGSLQLYRNAKREGRWL